LIRVWYRTPVSSANRLKYSTVGSSSRIVTCRFRRAAYGFRVALVKFVIGDVGDVCNGSENRTPTCCQAICDLLRRGELTGGYWKESTETLGESMVTNS